MADGFTRNSELWLQQKDPVPWRWIKCTEPYCTTFLVPLQKPQEPAVLIIGGCCGGTRYRVYLHDPALSFKLVDQGETWRFSWRLFQTCYFGPADFSGTFFEGNPDFGPAPAMPPLDAQTIDFTGMHTRK